MTNKDRLIQRVDSIIEGDFADELLSLAYTVENALLAAGAKPDTDYKILDLFKLAEPYAKTVFQEGRRINKIVYNRPGPFVKREI
ncbi:MAG: hypothetical protein IBX55_09875 [Methyloprofundus sp.]|nr:hypothetical protein [Methyloprofundus sp.]